MKKYFATQLSENIHKTPEGFLICYNVPIARTGDMVYGEGESPIKVGPDGTAIVSREAKEVFRPETIASFEGKPFTIKHPDDFVNPSNWKVLAKGHLQNVRQGTGANENDLIADILVTDAEAIALVEGGVREVSCGYEAEYIELGLGRGMQTNIIGNHLALVPQGRAGAAYAINDQKGAKMKKLGDKIKGIFAKAGDEAAKVVDESSEGGADSTDSGDEKAPAWATKLEKTMARVADGLEQVASMSQPSKYGDEDKEDDKDKKDAKDAEGEEKKDDKKDDAKDEEGEAAETSRLDKLEAKVDKLLALMGEGEDEEMMAEDEGEEEEAEDDDFEESPAAATGDEASRIEILAPGFKAKGKDAKRQALIEASKTKDTAAIIARLNGGKAPDLKKASQKTIDHLFVGTSEVVKVYRTKSFAGSKKVRDSQDMDFGASAEMTPEKINEINEKHYNAQKGVH